MRRFAIVFGLALLCAVSFADNLRADVMRMNKAVDHMFMTKNFDMFAKMVKAGVTSDFKYSEAGQSMGADQMVSTVRQSFASIDKVTMYSTKVVSLRENGDSARVTMHHRMRGISVDAKHKKHVMSFSGTSNSTFRKEHGKWMMSSMTFTENKMTMDGKPMPMTGGR